MEPGWYLREWVEARGLRQADLTRELGWAKNTAHRLWHNKQPYNRDQVHVVAAWLGIRPHELLVSPEEAAGLASLRSAATAIAAIQA